MSNKEMARKLIEGSGYKEANKIISEIMRVDNADLIYSLLMNLQLNEPYYSFTLVYKEDGGYSVLEQLLHDFKNKLISDKDFVDKVKSLIKNIKDQDEYKGKE